MFIFIMKFNLITYDPTLFSVRGGKNHCFDHTFEDDTIPDHHVVECLVHGFVNQVFDICVHNTPYLKWICIDTPVKCKGLNKNIHEIVSKTIDQATFHLVKGVIKEVYVISNNPWSLKEVKGMLLFEKCLLNPLYLGKVKNTCAKKLVFNKTWVKWNWISFLGKCSCTSPTHLH